MGLGKYHIHSTGHRRFHRCTN